VLDVPSLAFQLFNRSINRNSCIKTLRAKKIKIHRQHGGVLHFDGDPVMDGKDIEVEIIPQGLTVLASSEVTEGDEGPKNPLQLINEYFAGLKPKPADLFNPSRYNRLFELNKNLLRRLSKK
jgi:hypothetical protein